MRNYFRSNLQELSAPAVNVPVKKYMMCLNESWMDPYQEIRQTFLKKMETVHLNRYFSQITPQLRTALAEYIGFGITEEQFVWGNGADDILYHIFLAVRENAQSYAVSIAPSYFDYKTFCRAVDLNIRFLNLREDYSFDTEEYLQLAAHPDCRLAIVCNPNNPTGNLFPDEQILTILDEIRDKPVLIDETYFEFSGKTFLDKLADNPQLVIVRSFSKAFAGAGLRFGYAVSNTDNISQLKKVMTTFHSSILIQTFALSILNNREAFCRVVSDTICRRNELYKGLSEIQGLTVVPTETNFLILSMGERSGELFEYLKDNEVAVRDIGAHPLLKNFLRATISNDEDNNLLYKLISQFA
ncbi:MAG: histidinol-phosphate aminotransferase family protein [Candidatus Cloacimonetes bacterium]|nr:histidinol-phosphate aminotransferase family protein [Candidatus Cloacimonadota bacterium]